MRRQLIEESRAEYSALSALGEGNRKKMSLSISEPLAQAARQLDINLSRAAETGILQELELEKPKPSPLELCTWCMKEFRLRLF